MKEKPETPDESRAEAPPGEAHPTVEPYAGHRPRLRAKRRCGVVLATLVSALAAPAWAAEPTEIWARLLTDLVAPVQVDRESALLSERVTLDEAIALALDVNRLVKNPTRRRLIRESVIEAYEGVRHAHHNLATHRQVLKTASELESLMVERLDRGEVELPVMLQARTARMRAARDVVSAQQTLDAWTRQFNYLTGRDPQARVFITGGAGSAMSSAASIGQ
jgi:hypothetical protein